MAQQGTSCDLDFDVIEIISSDEDESESTEACSDQSLPMIVDVRSIAPTPTACNSKPPSFDSLFGKDIIVLGDGEEDTKEQTLDYALNDKFFVCEICNQRVKGFLNLNTHKNTHYKHNQVQVQQVRLVDPTKQTLYGCERCNQVFVTKSGVMNHQIYCSTLSTARGSRATNTSMTLPNGRPWKSVHACPICNKNFTQKGSMERHKKLIHDGIKPVQCADCLHRFRDKWNLKEHKCPKNDVYRQYLNKDATT